MLLLRGYEHWHGISFLGYHFSAVARGKKLCVIVIFYVGSAYVDMCRRSLLCGRKSLLPLLCGMLACLS